jgi:hypothetical protein
MHPATYPLKSNWPRYTGVLYRKKLLQPIPTHQPVHPAQRKECNPQQPPREPEPAGPDRAIGCPVIAKEFLTAFVGREEKNKEEKQGAYSKKAGIDEYLPGSLRRFLHDTKLLLPGI